MNFSSIRARACLPTILERDVVYRFSADLICLESGSFDQFRRKRVMRRRQNLRFPR